MSLSWNDNVGSQEQSLTGGLNFRNLFQCSSTSPEAVLCGVWRKRGAAWSTIGKWSVPRSGLCLHLLASFPHELVVAATEWDDGVVDAI